MNSTLIDQVFYYIYTENIDMIKSYPLDVLNVIHNHHTALSFAIHNNKRESFFTLIKMGVDVNLTMETGHSALMMSVGSSYGGYIDTLIQHGANMNLQRIDGNTATHLATTSGYDLALEKLVSAGADLNIKNKENMSALDFAFSKGYKKAYVYLFDKCAHTEKTLDSAISARDYYYINKLVREHFQVSATIVERIANSYGTTKQLEKIFDTIIRYDADINGVDWNNIHNSENIDMIQEQYKKYMVKKEQKLLNKTVLSAQKNGTKKIKI